MTLVLILAAVVLFAGVFCHKLSGKLGVPVLLAFILLGMVFGSDGLLKIPFENYAFAEQICTVALIVIIFYGGFGTNWREGKKVAGRSMLLASAGVVLTALFTGLFCHFVLGFEWLEGLLIGAVLGSTDAAAVFSILRSKRLNLKYGTASMLELESGSNDPWAYMLTMVLLSLLGGGLSAKDAGLLLFYQLFFGVLFGGLFAALGSWIIKRTSMEDQSMNMILLMSMALFSYAVPAYFGGNGYISAYLTGLVLGNQDFYGKKSVVHFFDGVTNIMQIVTFFLLGLLAFPSRMPAVLLETIGVFLFLLLISRPVATAVLLLPFKAHWSQILLVSWAGLRGATSIVFAIMVTVGRGGLGSDVFHIVFGVVLLSIGIQGTLLPAVARKLDMLDDRENVLKTFSDYSDEMEIQFIRLGIEEHHPWVGQAIRELQLIPGTRIALILRKGTKVLPKGETVIEADDELILSTESYGGDPSIELCEIHLDEEHRYCGKSLSELQLQKMTVVLLQREGSAIIPAGDTTLQAGDVLVVWEE